jgi:hypothetical protein
MRLIAWLCFFLISFMTHGQVSLGTSPNSFISQAKHPQVKIRLRCLATVQCSVEPLYIIDGIPSGSEILRKINPNDIDSVTVLKASNSVEFFSCRPNNGVILITTKKDHKTNFLIKDNLNGSGLPGSTISFVSLDEKHDTLIIAANDAGEIVTRLQAGKTYQVSVTSTGYKDLSFHYKAAINPTETLFLERNIRECLPAIVQSPGSRTIRCGMTMLVVHGKNQNGSDLTNQNSIVVYPNPVGKGGTLIVEMEELQLSSIVIKLFNGGGQEIFSETYSNINNVKKIPIGSDRKWPAWDVLHSNHRRKNESHKI